MSQGVFIVSESSPIHLFIFDAYFQMIMWCLFPRLARFVIPLQLAGRCKNKVYYIFNEQSHPSVHPKAVTGSKQEAYEPGVSVSYPTAPRAPSVIIFFIVFSIVFIIVVAWYFCCVVRVLFGLALGLML